MSAITEIIDWSQRFTFGGPRVRPIMGICVHTTENAIGTRAENVAQYQIDSQTGSYHRLVDSAGRVLIENTDDWTTWSVGNQGNDVLLHVSCVARASMTRDDWLGQPRMFDALAQQVANWSALHGIPLIERTAQDLLQGKKGLYGHDDCRIWGGTDHTDPGPGFPWDVLVKRATALQNNTQEEKTMPELSGVSAAALNDTKLAAVDTRAQLTGSPKPGEYPGWPQLGGRTVVDALAVIGQKLGIDGFQDRK